VLVVVISAVLELGHDRRRRAILFLAALVLGLLNTFLKPAPQVPSRGRSP
jgi:uncharacterized membrane protein YvlD (DUF360 family)